SPAKVGSKDIWKETIEWGWKFKGNDAWLVLNFKGDKRFKSAELRYPLAKKRYEMTMTDKDDNKLTFEGKMQGEYFILERVDPATKETQQLKMNTAAEGARLIMLYSYKGSGKTLFTKDYQVSATKEGLSLGAKDKKNECVVSGGLGTSAVSFK